MLTDHLWVTTFFEHRQSLISVKIIQLNKKIYIMTEETQPTSLPLIFTNTPKEILEAEVFTSFPPYTFVENIAIDTEGNLFVTSVEDGAVYKITEEGEKEEYAKVKGKLVGITPVTDKSYLVNGWNEEGIPTIYLLSGKHTIVPLLHLQEALFLNGMASIGDDAFLICDSYKGCIWKYNLETNTADIWLNDPLLARVDDTHTIPAANGIKVFNDTVFVSNTDKQFLIKIPLNNAHAGTPELFMEKLLLDDFAIDNDGTIYATTHIYNNVVRITQEKEVAIIGEAEQGLAGSTAVAFGRREADKNFIYVTTNGGMSLPLPGGVQEGRVVKIKVK